MTSPFAPLAKLAKPVNHTEALRTMVYRRDHEPMSDESRARLEKVIATYRRLYGASP